MAKGKNRYKISWYKPVWVQGELKQPGDVIEIDNAEVADMTRSIEQGGKIYTMIEPYKASAVSKKKD